MPVNDRANANSAVLLSTTTPVRVAPVGRSISVSGRISRVIAIATTPSLKAMIRWHGQRLDRLN